MSFTRRVINSLCHKLWAVTPYEITELHVVVLKNVATTPNQIHNEPEVFLRVCICCIPWLLAAWVLNTQHTCCSAFLTQVTPTNPA